MASRFGKAAVIAASLVAFMLAGCGKKEGPPANADVPIGVNLVKNPSFEEYYNGMPVDWRLEDFEGQGSNVVRYGRDAAEKASGQYSFFLRGIFNTQQWKTLVQRVPVIPGYRLDISAAMKGTNLKPFKGKQGKSNIFVRFLDAKGNRLNTRYYADGWTMPFVGTTEWSRSSKLVDIPEEARSAEVGFVVQMMGWLYFDDVEAKIVKPIPWQKIETKNVDYYYFAERPFPPGTIKKHSARVEQWMKILGIKIDSKINYYYYPSEEVFKELLGVKRAHDRTVWKKRILHTTKPDEEHEIIHILLVDLGHPPFGLAEGIVFYLIGSWDGQDLHMIAKELLMARRVVAFHSLLTQKQMEDAGMTPSVQAWASFSKYLIDKYGMKKFLTLYAATDGPIDDMARFNVHFKDAYGTELDVVDRDWRLFVMRYRGRSD